MDKGSLLLMSCCAPCSADAIKKLKSEGRDFSVLFYNPNIFPQEEYGRRLAEQRVLCEKHGAKITAGPWNHKAWLTNMQGLEREPERGARCAKCFALRAAFGIKFAREYGFPAVASVFGTSPHKDQGQVDAAFRIGPSGLYDNRRFGYLPEGWMYRQKYCGCEFSETFNAGNKSIANKNNRDGHEN
ncbi:MAG: epoxyqueuosine reductase QueH [Rickettsiales bacterium]|jgi:predicted adenine nucleotide alpha hydrolase (AANH) superfamily ATPase|nr:epoxyqueuosine reductase QueH [Rickettsiales bacterium]